MLDYILYSLSLSITPGANCISSMENASKKGFPKCLSFNIGILTGQIIVFSLTFVLLQWIVDFIPKADPVLQIFGAVYIIYIGVSLLTKGKIAVGNSSGTFKTGFILQFLNVKLFCLGATSISSYVIPMTDNLFCRWIYTMILPLICLVSHVTWAVAGASIAGFYNKHTKLFNAFFASILFYQAICNMIKFFY